MPETAAFAPSSPPRDQRGPLALRLGRALFDRLETVLADSRLSSAAALGGAAALGRLRAALSGRWPSASEVAALYGTGRLESRRIALGIAANEARNRLVIRRGVGRSLAPFAPLVRWRDEGAAAALQSSLGPSVVLLTAHVGALYLLAAGLDRVARRRTVLRWSPLHLPSPEEVNAPTAGGVVRRTAALRRALDALRRGGVVSTALDGAHGAAEPGELFGRSLGLGVGGFALARLSGARVVPVAALWEGNRVVCELGASAQERVETPAEALRWFEALLRRAPQQISLGLLRQLLFGTGVGSAVDPTIRSSGEHAVRR